MPVSLIPCTRRSSTISRRRRCAMLRQIILTTSVVVAAMLVLRQRLDRCHADRQSGELRSLQVSTKVLKMSMRLYLRLSRLTMICIWLRNSKATPRSPRRHMKARHQTKHRGLLRPCISHSLRSMFRKANTSNDAM